VVHLDGDPVRFVRAVGTDFLTVTRLRNSGSAHFASPDGFLHAGVPAAPRRIARRYHSVQTIGCVGYPRLAAAVETRRKCARWDPAFGNLVDREHVTRVANDLALTLQTRSNRELTQGP
jgi:hypothetical protein